MRKSILTLAFIFIFLLAFIPLKHTDAHVSPKTCHTNGEPSGFRVDCNNHQASKSFTYNLQDVDSIYAGYVANGASRWNNTGTTNISKTSTESTNGRVIKYSDPNASTIAYFGNYYSDTRGHLYSWTLGMNTSFMSKKTAAENSKIMAHELGHAIGLYDLNNAYNNGMLMYGYSDGTASFPTTSDIAGAKEAIIGS